jgi:hypothetical protein
MQVIIGRNRQVGGLEDIAILDHSIQARFKRDDGDGVPTNKRWLGELGGIVGYDADCTHSYSIEIMN